jgi:hypothetical protein
VSLDLFGEGLDAGLLDDSTAELELAAAR